MNSLVLSTTIITGRLPKAEFDAISLSNSMLATYGLAIVIGQCTACDTLFSQTMGSRDQKRTGMWLQKGLLVLNAFAIVLCAVHFNMEPIFLLIGQFPEVAKMAGISSCYMAPSILFFANFTVLLRYLQNKDIIYIPVFITMFACGFNIVAQYILIYVFGLGYIAAAYTQTASYGLMLLLEVAYFFFGKKYVNTWDGFRREALTNWGEFAHLAMCGVGHYTFESISLNLGILLSGTLSETFLAAQAILYHFENLLYAASYSLSISVNIRVGQLLGQLNPEAAKFVAKCGVIVAGIMFIVCAAIIGPLQYQIPYIFTNHEDIANLVGKNIWVMIPVFALDCLRSNSDGTLRGCGRQLVGALLIVIAFSGIALPIGIYLLFNTELLLTGYWLGICTGNFCILPFAFVFLKCLNWHKEAIRTQERVLKAYKTKRIATEKTPLVQTKVVKPRHPREPRSCSTNFAEMSCQADVSDDDFRRLLWIRGVTYAVCLFVFFAAIIFNFAVPHDLYRPVGNGTEY